MAIRPLAKTIPRDFVPARLYLDDIEEILRIFADTERDQQEKGRDPNEKLRTAFVVGNETCDEMADLRKIHPPYAHNFTVGAERRGFTAKVNISESSAQWYAYGLTENEEWGIFHKLQRVFEARKLRWKASLRSHSHFSNWLEGAMWGASFSFFVGLQLAAQFSRTATVAMFAGLLVFVTVAVALRLGLRRHSVVIFRSRSEYHSERRQTAWKVLPEIIKLTVAFLLGLMTEYIKHKLWP